MRRGTLDNDQWWQQLAPAERRALRSRRESRPLHVVGRFVEPGDGEPTDDVTDYYEYLVNHEILLVDARPFHICSAHPAARAAVASGIVPSTFLCPRHDEACPMRQLLGTRPGRDLQLSVEEAAR